MNADLRSQGRAGFCGEAVVDAALRMNRLISRVTSECESQPSTPNSIRSGRRLAQHQPLPNKRQRSDRSGPSGCGEHDVATSSTMARKSVLDMDLTKICNYGHAREMVPKPAALIADTTSAVVRPVARKKIFPEVS
jgi:hypothetical protein